MELEYKLILGGWIFNWALSLGMYNKYVRFDNLLGVWLAFYQVMVICCLVSLGDVGWKHGILIAFAGVALFGTASAVFSGKGTSMGAGTFVTAIIMAPIWLWLLFS